MKKSLGIRPRHGHTSRSGASPTYKTWQAMRQRCSNPHNDNYKNYGARGIKVCERWQSFINFLADMGERPEGKTLDRIDSNGDYTLPNCRWATQTEQKRNTRRNVYYVMNGERLCLAEWAKRFGIDDGVVCHRLKLGWDLHVALTAPVRPQRPSL